MEKVTSEEFSKILFETVIPQLVVAYGLVNLFKEDQKEALRKILEIVEEEKLFDQNKGYLIIRDFNQEIKHLSNLIEKIEERDYEEFSEMFIYEAVSIFEAMVNEYLRVELLMKYGFDEKKSSQIIKSLNMPKKLGWFLEMLIGEDLTKTELWHKINPYIKTRNFLIHYNPCDSEDYHINVEKLSRKSVDEFLGYVREIYEYLASKTCAETIQYKKNIEMVKESLQNRESIKR